MIRHHGPIQIPAPLREYADTIKLQNYKVNTPAKFQVHPIGGLASARLRMNLGKLLGAPADRIDYVFFSCCNGAEEHVDQLDPQKHGPNTIIIPIILPTGRSTITAQGETVEVQLDHAYDFDHTKPHSMTLEDTESGCVVIMATVLRA